MDLPFNVQMAGIKFDIDTYESLTVNKLAATPQANRQSPRRACCIGTPTDRPRKPHHQRRCQSLAGLAGRADSGTRFPDADGLGRDTK